MSARSPAQESPSICLRNFPNAKFRPQQPQVRHAARSNPRYIQVFIDDLTGAAGCDRVTLPPSVTGIVFDDAAAAALGCVPAPVDSRLRVHSQLTVLAITRCGLSAPRVNARWARPSPPSACSSTASSS